MPTDRTTARRVSRLIEKPNSCIRKTAPIIEIGMAMIGTSTVRMLPMNRKITTITMMRVSTRVLTTSKIDSSI